MYFTFSRCSLEQGSKPNLILFRRERSKWCGYQDHKQSNEQSGLHRNLPGEPPEREIHLVSNYTLSHGDQPWPRPSRLIKEGRNHRNTLICTYWFGFVILRMMENPNQVGLNQKGNCWLQDQKVQRRKTSGEAWSSIWNHATRSQLLSISPLCLSGCFMLHPEAPSGCLWEAPGSHIIAASWQPTLKTWHPHTVPQARERISSEAKKNSSMSPTYHWLIGNDTPLPGPWHGWEWANRNPLLETVV